ncbi:unnamed protein product [Heligmosomoides polygyrus]|uniref:Nuclear receptor domain-containing protein n=1 Tax=Heligmosomoides polygyrus TaxID=6339 RepID=A0A3P7XQ90_HELPZ|nr:unnamed protein product [Heligmosomoides polygyrus]
MLNSVCEDPKGSVHFGVVSCAACSAFFRRTVSENRKYTCRQHRCYCRACRLQKCLLMGMDPGSTCLRHASFCASLLTLSNFLTSSIFCRGASTPRLWHGSLTHSPTFVLCAYRKAQRFI